MEGFRYKEGEFSLLIIQLTSAAWICYDFANMYSLVWHRTQFVPNTPVVLIKDYLD